jgi:hypothetical protein
MHCRHYIPTPQSRREMLTRCANGFGAMALAALWADESRAASEMPGNANLTALHHAAKARNVIFLYMDGGPSQVDTFDYKPILEKHHGVDPSTLFKVEPTQFDNVGAITASPWKFKQYGQSGAWVSDLFPHVARHVDKLAIVRSMVAQFPEHTSANYFLHTGTGIQGRPSMGAWTSYGLGSENAELPGFIVLNGGLIPPGGIDNFNSGFLPAAYQASVFRSGDPPVANIIPREKSPEEQRRKLDLIAALDGDAQARNGTQPEIEAAIANYETAFRMQTAVPELMNLSGETAMMKRLYGMEAGYEPTRIFAAECLLARRLIERGARFVELTCPKTGGNDRWDQHAGLKTGHEANALAVDQPIAALLEDLQARGLLESTLVVWAGEFGRTPFAQGDGRDHDPFGFTIWLAGGGVRGGTVYGETDEFGYKAIRDRVEIHDLHATMLHLLGVDHKRLTFRFGGRDMRLTDVHGKVVDGILA